VNLSYDRRIERYRLYAAAYYTALYKYKMINRNVEVSDLSPHQMGHFERETVE
jgi:hypothetical protein